jgi:hypothetical protein
VDCIADKFGGTEAFDLNARQLKRLSAGDA